MDDNNRPIVKKINGKINKQKLFLIGKLVKEQYTRMMKFNSIISSREGRGTARESRFRSAVTRGHKCTQQEGVAAATTTAADCITKTN